MPRSSLLPVTVLLLLALVGLMAASSAYRARPEAQPPQQLGPSPGPPVTVPPKKPKGLSYSVVSVRRGHTLSLRSSPGGRVVATAWWITEYGSSAELSVAATRGRWLGLTSSDRPNGTLGWVRADNPSLEVHTTRMSVRIDLSSRSLELRNGREVVRRATVGIGRVGSATPTGRYSITDELRGKSFGRYYGCCIIALSGHQVNKPSGWSGGDRLAIHGTNDPRSIGMRSSAGCLHADGEDMRMLMRRVPLGTPVFIHA
jgi:lipoprotein-anchoring transpeptidase ErfK/SrfK